MDKVGEILLLATLPGAGGGLAWFFCGLRNSWIRNNKHIRKGMLEIFGGMLVASFIGYPISGFFSGSTPIVLVCFAIGACWSGIIQILRGWITGHVKSFLNTRDE